MMRTGTDLADREMSHADAAAEGLGAIHGNVKAAGGHLLYATPEGAESLVRDGYEVRAVKQGSARHPGVAVVAAVPTGRPRQCPYCGQASVPPGGTRLFRCPHCGQVMATAPAAVQTAPPQMPQYPSARPHKAVGTVGRTPPLGGAFTPIFGGD